jgi:hypothetical protein
VVETVLHLVPQAGSRQGLLDDVVVVVALHARQLEPGENVAPDGHAGERVGLLENHADLQPDVDRIDIALVDVLALVENRARERGTRDEFVEPVEGADERRLAAAGRADERGHRVDALEHLALPEPHADIARGHLGGADLDGSLDQLGFHQRHILILGG